MSQSDVRTDKKRVLFMNLIRLNYKANFSFHQNQRCSEMRAFFMILYFKIQLLAFAGFLRFVLKIVSK